MQPVTNNPSDKVGKAVEFTDGASKAMARALHRAVDLVPGLIRGAADIANGLESIGIALRDLNARVTAMEEAERVARRAPEGNDDSQRC